LTSFVSGITKVITFLGSTAEQFPTITGLLVAFGTAMAGFLALSVFAKLGAVFGILGGGLEGVSAQFVAMRVLLSDLVGGLAVLSNAVGSVAAFIGATIGLISRTFPGLGGVAMMAYSPNAGAGEDKAVAGMVNRNQKNFGISGSGWEDKNFGTTGAGRGGPSTPSHLFPSVALGVAGGHGHAGPSALEAMIAQDSKDAHKSAKTELAASAAAAADIADVAATVTKESAAKADKPASIRKKYYDMADKLQKAGQPALAAKARHLGDINSVKAQLDLAKAHLSNLKTNLTEEQKVVAAQVITHTLTHQQGQIAISGLQHQAGPGLTAAAQNVLALQTQLNQLAPAAAKSTAGLQAAIIGFQNLGNSLTSFQVDVVNTFQNGLAQFFSSFMRGNMTWRMMGQQLSAMLLTGLNQAVSMSLAQSIIGTGGAQAAAGAVGNPAGLFGLGGMIGSLFSSGTQAAAPIVSQSFAVGANNVPNDMVANIHKGEMIIPAAGANAIRSGQMSVVPTQKVAGSGGNANFHGNVNVVVNHGGAPASAGGNAPSVMQNFGTMIGEHVRGIILNEMRPGGMLSGSHP
jgi:hypothetical protein